MLKYPLAVTIDTNIFDSAKYDLSVKEQIPEFADYWSEAPVPYE